MPRRRRSAPTPLPISVVNRKCKIFLIRQCFICTLALSLMTYFLRYEQVNVAVRSKLLDDSDLTVMSYNVRGSNLDFRNTTKWKSRKQVSLEMISIYKPDLIGLQEPQKNQIDTFKQNGYNSYGKYRATSILYNRDKFIMIDGDTLWLSETPNIEHSKSWDMDQERVVTWILVKTRNNNNCINDNDDDDDDDGDRDTAQCQANEIKDGSYLIFNTHLDHRGENSRMESCVVIKDIIYKISTIKYEDKYPVLITGDFNVAKYSNVWECFINENEENEENEENDMDSFELKDALHDSRYFAPFKKLQLQYTYHYFHGLQMNKWYMRMTQYLFFGFSNSVVKWFRNIYFFRGVCCMAPSLYRQIYRRRHYNRRAGIHHVDWILYGDNDKIESVEWFEVIAYHQLIDTDKQPPIKWSLRWFFHDRFVDKTIYPSDHFPIIAGFKMK